MQPVVGMIGGGQLARMTFQAAISLDVRLEVVAAAADPIGVSSSVLVEPLSENVRAWAAGWDVLTFDHEGVDLHMITDLVDRGVAVRPGPATLASAVDKSHQRRVLSNAGLPVPAHSTAGDATALGRFGADHGWPIVLKTPTGGYDGRGVWMAHSAAEASEVLAEVGRPLLVEEAVAIDTELAVVIARRPGGGSMVYPVVETVQRDGICHELLVPARVDSATAAAARDLAIGVAAAVDACGILAVELFHTVDGQLLVNEIAARPHNSGHFSIEGCVTSQFENHLRAVLDWPLGSTELRAPAVATANILAADATSDPGAAVAEALELGDVHVHLYGKQARPGRKLGHVTVLGADVVTAADLANRAAKMLAAPRPDPR